MTPTDVYATTNQEALSSALAMIDLRRFAGKTVPIKLHMGEPGNPCFVRPELARLVADAIRHARGHPFLFDTVVAYPGDRSHRRGYERVAQQHGFTRANVGCHVVIGERGVRVLEADVPIEVASQIYDADCMLVLSHVKGHIQAGFGGAIKNLGMGGVTKASKRRVHSMSMPLHDAHTCTLCGLCVPACPSRALTVDSEWHINRRACEGCGKCVLACTTGALQFEHMSLARGLAISAMACIRNKDVVYVNSLHNIVENCDCDCSPGRVLCQDVGYLAGTGAAAVDAASLDLIDQVEPQVFERYTGVDPREQVACAVTLGMNDQYVLHRL